MREHPIIFTGESVRAILDGRKTQTRRLIPQWAVARAASNAGGLDPVPGQCWFPGDKLWVRETWCCEMADGTYTGSYLYRADGVEVYADDGDGGRRYRKDGWEASPWISPMRMPRKASRITLEVLSVRIQRLQDISEEDALAEGVIRVPRPELGDGAEMYRFGDDVLSDTAGEAYERAWDAINGKRASWASNPWIWAIEFKRLAEHTTHKEA